MIYMNMKMKIYWVNVRENPLQPDVTQGNLQRRIYYVGIVLNIQIFKLYAFEYIMIHILSLLIYFM